MKAQSPKNSIQIKEESASENDDSDWKKQETEF